MKKTDITNRMLWFLRIMIIGMAFVLLKSQSTQSTKANEIKDNVVADTTFRLNTIVEQKWYGDNANKTVEEINSELDKLENNLSSYIETSEISNINKNAGKEWVKIQDSTYDILKRAKELSVSSDGKFDITIFPLVELWGITSDNPKIPEQSKINETIKLVDVNYLQLKADENNNKFAFLEKENMALDLGGIAKGFGADIVQNIATKNNCEGYASLGGNLSVVGKKPDGGDFKFGLRNPRGGLNEYIGIVTLNGKTMATTGDYERYFMVNDKRYHHILDKATGYPADTDLISATIISSDGTLADYLSTTVFSSGTKNLDKFMHDPNYGVVAVDKDLNVYVSSNLKDIFVFKDDSNTFHLK